MTSIKMHLLKVAQCLMLFIPLLLFSIGFCIKTAVAQPAKYFEHDSFGTFELTDDKLLVAQGKKIYQYSANNPDQLQQVYDLDQQYEFEPQVVLDGQTLYYADYLGGRVNKLTFTNNAQGKQETLLNHSLKSPGQMVLHGNYLYVTDYTQSLIFKIDLRKPANENIVQVISSPIMISPNGLAIVGETMYVACTHLNSIVKFNLYDHNPNIEPVIQNGLDAPFALLYTHGKMYVSNMNSGKVVRFNTTHPQDVETVFTLKYPTHLRVNGTNMYIKEWKPTPQILQVSLGQPESNFQGGLLAGAIYPNPVVNRIHFADTIPGQKGQLVNLLGKPVMHFDLESSHTSFLLIRLLLPVPT